MKTLSIERALEEAQDHYDRMVADKDIIIEELKEELNRLSAKIEKLEAEIGHEKA